MDRSQVLALLLHGNQLKRTARTGWAQRGVPLGENVAAHTFGVAYTTLVLARVVDEEVDLGRALAMALLHDLPEGLTGDIPSPVMRFLSRDTKKEMELQALEEMVGDTSFGQSFTAWWKELEADKSVEARLVHDADKIDLLVQALIFEEQSGNRHLGEFWEGPIRFHFEPSRQIYAALSERRAGGSR